MPDASAKVRAGALICRGAEYARLGDIAKALADCNEAINLYGAPPDFVRCAREFLNDINRSGPIFIVAEPPHSSRLSIDWLARVDSLLAIEARLPHDAVRVGEPKSEARLVLIP